MVNTDARGHVWEEQPWQFRFGWAVPFRCSSCAMEARTTRAGYLLTNGRARPNVKPCEKRTALLAVEKLQTEPAPGPSPADVGPIPMRHFGCADTCASYDEDDVREGARG